MNVGTSNLNWDETGVSDWEEIHHRRLIVGDVGKEAGHWTQRPY